MFLNKKRMVNNFPNYQPLNNEIYQMNNYDLNRLINEINEIKRTQTEMLSRINRLENYLGVRGEFTKDF